MGEGAGFGSLLAGRIDATRILPNIPPAELFAISLTLHWLAINGILSDRAIVVLSMVFSRLGPGFSFPELLAHTVLWHFLYRRRAERDKTRLDGTPKERAAALAQGSCWAMLAAAVIASMVFAPSEGWRWYVAAIGFHQVSLCKWFEAGRVEVGGHVFPGEQVAQMRARLHLPWHGAARRERVTQCLHRMMRLIHLAETGRPFPAGQFAFNLGRVQELLGDPADAATWPQAFVPYAVVAQAGGRHHISAEPGLAAIWTLRSLVAEHLRMLHLPSPSEAFLATG